MQNICTVTVTRLLSSILTRQLKAVQEALRAASQQINGGNQVGLITFSDRPVRRINFAPFNELEKKRLLTAIDELKPDGATALYDAVAVGLGDLMNQKKHDLDRRFYLLLLADGERTDRVSLASIRDVINALWLHPVALTPLMLPLLELLYFVG